MIQKVNILDMNGYNSGCVYLDEKHLYHRLDGPARIWNTGEIFWYIRDVKYNPEEHPFNIFRTEHQLPEDYNEWSIEMKVLFKITYGGL